MLGRSNVKKIVAGDGLLLWEVRPKMGLRFGLSEISLSARMKGEVTPSE